MGKTLVDKKFIEDAKQMAYDLYGLADMNGHKEVKKRMNAFMKRADKFLEKMELNK